MSIVRNTLHFSHQIHFCATENFFEFLFILVSNFLQFYQYFKIACFYGKMKHFELFEVDSDVLALIFEGVKGLKIA